MSETGQVRPTPTGEGSATHTHRCLRCDETFACRAPGQCLAQEDVLPRLPKIEGAQLVGWEDHCTLGPDGVWRSAHPQVPAAVPATDEDGWTDLVMGVKCDDARMFDLMDAICTAVEAFGGVEWTAIQTARAAGEVHSEPSPDAPTPTVEGSGEPYYRAIHDPRCDWRNAAGSEKPPCNCDELVPTPPASRGTGVSSEKARALVANHEKVAMAAAHLGATELGDAESAVLAHIAELEEQVRTLSAAAEQGERDREAAIAACRSRAESLRGRDPAAANEAEKCALAIEARFADLAAARPPHQGRA